MNTAATQWCSAVVGFLAGFRLPSHAAIGTLIVLGIHVGLRPVSRWVDARRKNEEDVEVSYRLRVVCEEKEQAVVRAILPRHGNAKPMMAVHGISTQDGDEPDWTVVTVDIFSTLRNERAMEDLERRLDIEPSVTAISREKRQ
jgi:putative Mg2+ transporter-C (MgtC) family protein